jgi:prepilin-type N-terminal cleavage/methylation domain-containing protein
MEGGTWNVNSKTIRKGYGLNPKSKIQNPKFSNGFTLIEIIVVISLISLILFIAIPRFHNSVLTDSTKKTSRWITAKIRVLKESAVREHKLYVLSVDMDSNSMWVTHASMTEDELQGAPQNAYQLPDDIRVLAVEYPHDDKIEAGRADIYFYEKGYSDMAIIHIENSDSEPFSFRIEPFLQQVKIFQQYVGFEE